MVRLILCGPPGSGKGTQAAELAAQLGVQHVSPGEIFRTAVAQQTELGQQVQSYMDRGQLVPDELVINLMRERLQQPQVASGWILDGFPRNQAQAESLDQMLKDLNQVYDYVINLDVPDQVVIDRMLQRGRGDDNEQVIRDRLQIYRDQTAPLIQYYRDRNHLVGIDGTQSVAQVTDSIKAVIQHQHGQHH